jgi:hypothetical protein
MRDIKKMQEPQGIGYIGNTEAPCGEEDLGPI